MRLKPVTSDGTFVEFDHDVELGGYTIPGKTLLWLPFYRCSAARGGSRGMLAVRARALTCGPVPVRLNCC